MLPFSAVTQDGANSFFVKTPLAQDGRCAQPVAAVLALPWLGRIAQLYLGDRFLPNVTAAVNLLVPVGVKAEGTNLTPGKTQEMGSGLSFQLYSAGAVGAGQTFTAKMSGSPTAAATTTA